MKSIKEVMSCRTTLDDGNDLVYKYYITEEERKINYEDQSVEVKGYGICAESEKIKNDKTQIIFKDSIDFINPYKEKVMDIIDFLKNNKVSPIHIVDVIGEEIDDMVQDFDVEIESLLGYEKYKKII